MSVDYETFIGVGWKLTNSSYDGIPVDEGLPASLEELMDNGYLHYVDAYCDELPFFLGVETYCSTSDGTVTELGNVIPTLSVEQMTELQTIAKEHFGITSPPQLCLVSRVY